MKWGNLPGPFSSFIIHPSTLLPAADLETFANEWFIAKRSVEKLQGVVNPVAHLASVEQTFLSASSSSNADRNVCATFLSHLVPLRDAGLEKLYVFLRFPHRRHPAARKRWSRSSCRSPILSFLLMFSRNGMSSRLAMTLTPSFPPLVSPCGSCRHDLSLGLPPPLGCPNWERRRRG